MLHARTRQALSVVVAVAVVCSFVGTPVAAAATLGDESGSSLDGLDGDSQTSTEAVDDETSTNDSEDSSSNDSDDSTDDSSSNDSDDSTDDDTSSNDSDDSTDDGDDSTDDGENESGDRTVHSDDSSGAEDADGSESVTELVNETAEAVENVTDGIENGSGEILEVDEDAVNETLDRVVNYAELQTALGLDVFGTGPLEGDTGHPVPTYTYDQSAQNDRGEHPDGSSADAESDTPATAVAVDTGAGEGDDPKPANPAGGATIGFGAVATAAALRGSPVVAGSRAARSSGFLTRLLEKVRPFVLPLRYSRYDDSDPLEHDARERVYEIVNETPGSYLSEVSQEADLPLSTTRHHIKVLEREDLVSGAKIHGKRRFYPAYAEGIELAAALNDDSTASIIRAIARIGAASVSDLADELGRDPSTISHHLQRLEEDGLITRERDGRSVVNKLSAEARVALEPETAPEPPERGEVVAGGAD